MDINLFTQPFITNHASSVGILHHEDEPPLPYPDCTLESLAHSTTAASPLTGVPRESLSALLERSLDWSDAHQYSPYLVCSEGHMCSRLLHASLCVKVHSLLLVSGAEGAAEMCSRRVIHPLDVVTALIQGDASGWAVGVLHAEYKEDPSVLEPILQSWARAAGPLLRDCDLLTRMCTMGIVSLLLTGPQPAFRHPHSAEPHAHLRTGPQLASSVEFFRISSTHIGDAADVNGNLNRFGPYLSLINEACDTLFAPKPLSLLSLGCAGDHGECAGLSVFCRSLRLLTAVGSVDPVFVRFLLAK